MATARLRLRPPAAADLTAIAAMHRDPEVTAYLGVPLDDDGTRAFLDRIALHRRRHGFGLFAVERLDEPGAIGLVGLAVPGFTAPFTPCVEIGWRLARTHWGQGYAHEAAEACLALGFERLGLAAIVAFTVPANGRSRRLMERLRMIRDPAADFDHPRLPEGHPLRRHVLYRRAAAAWRLGRPG